MAIARTLDDALRGGDEASDRGTPIAPDRRAERRHGTGGGPGAGGHGLVAVRAGEGLRAAGGRDAVAPAAAARRPDVGTPGPARPAGKGRLGRVLGGRRAGPARRARSGVAT